MSNSSFEKTSDSSYLLAGEMEGIKKLCTDFYRIMEHEEVAKHIRLMHKDDFTIMIDKLTLFLCMWLGGPKIYIEKYQFVGMPAAHQHLVINEEERDAWLFCMSQALELQPYEASFKNYLRQQFWFPANMIMMTAKKNS